jgi:hypothetical protein
MKRMKPMARATPATMPVRPAVCIRGTILSPLGASVEDRNGAHERGPSGIGPPSPPGILDGA